MPDKIYARAPADAPQPSSNEDWEAVYSLITDLQNRIIALEAQPAARDGRDGAPGRDGAQGLQGEAGPQGERGEAGPPGQDGRGVAHAMMNKDGVLILTMTDGSAVEVGHVVGKAGEKGEPGVDGQDGVNGKDGRDGVSVIGARLSDDGGLVVSLSDGTQQDVGCIVGRDGADGVNGKDGAPGPQGDPGIPGEIDENMLARVTAEVVERQVKYAVGAAVGEVEARITSRIDNLFLARPAAPAADLTKPEPPKSNARGERK